MARFRGSLHFKTIDRDFNPAARQYLINYVARIVFPLKGKKFSHLSAERDIQPEKPNVTLTVSTNGVGATTLIQTIINRDNYDSNLIEKTLLDKLNEIIKPDIFFTRILVQQNELNNWKFILKAQMMGAFHFQKWEAELKPFYLFSFFYM